MTRPRWKQLILDAKEIISTEDKWIKGTPAVDVYGKPTLPWSHDARKFCTIGALGAAQARGYYTSESFSEAMIAVHDAIPMDIYAGSISMFNDDPSTKLSDVHALLDKAVKR